MTTFEKISAGEQMGKTISYSNRRALRTALAALMESIA